MRLNGWTRQGVCSLFVGMTAILLPAFLYAQPPAARNVTSQFDVRLGGYVQLNVTWDSDDPDDSTNNMRAFAVTKGSPEEGRETLRWFAGRTRMFVDVRGPEIWGARTRGYVEWDFDADQATSTTAHNIRLRRAYARMDWPGWYLLLGQDSVLITDAVSSESEISGTTSGRRGDKTGGTRSRSPQIQVGSRVPMGGARLDLSGAVIRNNTDRDSSGNLMDSGARADAPALTALAKLTVKAFGRDAVFAVSGYWGEEKLTSGATERDVDNTAIALEALIPLGPATPIGAFDIRGNWFTAENMARWNLGNNAGVTATGASIVATKPDEIQTHGFWVEGNWKVNRNLAFGIGFGHQEDDTGDLRKAIAVRPATLVEENEGWWLHAAWTEGPVLIFIQYSNIETTRLSPALTRTETDSQEIHLVFRRRF